ncbi:MAG: acetoin utilization protein AcuC, partial [Frankia sp.]|nr:acetoin utilization protein AcuC [Frankia sp.]
MSDSTLVIWDEVFTSYDFGPTHPLRPLRLELTMALAAACGVFDNPAVTIAPPRGAGDDMLELVHDRDYIGAVRRTPDNLLGRLPARYGLGPGDNPIFPRMHEAASLVTGASVDACRAVWEGRAQHAVNLAGGLHHAMAARASGFCIYDDPAVGIAWLLANGASRVAYVDIDVHHGDGVQAAFYDDPRVLTVSLHETGQLLFPGTGFPDELGSGAGRGTSVNVALPPHTDDAAWLRAFAAVVPPLLRAYRPEILVAQLGCDTHALDPLAHLRLSVDGQAAAYRSLHELAHELCGGRWVVLGGGGYEIVQVVPRAWTLALAEVTGTALTTANTPAEWHAVVA